MAIRTFTCNEQEIFAITNLRSREMDERLDAIHDFLTENRCISRTIEKQCFCSFYPAATSPISPPPLLYLITLLNRSCFSKYSYPFSVPVRSGIRTLLTACIVCAASQGTIGHGSTGQELGQVPIYQPAGRYPGDSDHSFLCVPECHSKFYSALQYQA